MSGGALSGVRVVDLTKYQAGPSCTQLLGWLGAEVTKIEEPGKGDDTRSVYRDREGLDSLFFLVLNANKKSLTLSLRHEKGRQIFVALLKTADVLVENLAPGAVDRLGFGWERVHEINPRVVYASIKGYGSRGPYAGYKSLEWQAQAMGGAMSVCGPVDGPPMINGAAIGDSGAGVNAVIGILAALHQRHTTGEGQYVDISMQDAVCNLIRVRFRDHQRLGRPPLREGTGKVGFVGFGMFACAPGGPNDYVFVNTQAPSLPNLCMAIGRPELWEEFRALPPEKWPEHTGRVKAIVAAWTGQRDKHEATRLLCEAGVPAGAVMDTEDILHDPHLREREMIVEVPTPGRGRFFTVGNPVKLSASQVSMASPPTLGQHTAAVLKELLSISDSEIESLRQAGVI
ncbi:MAG: CoA transferase [Chloroflexi bacterium]|nr:CoA transferase [Chloroflexota bacterium]